MHAWSQCGVVVGWQRLHMGITNYGVCLIMYSFTIICGVGYSPGPSYNRVVLLWEWSYIMGWFYYYYYKGGLFRQDTDVTRTFFKKIFPGKISSWI